MTNNQLTDERVTSVIERLEHYACNLKWTNVRGAQDLLAAADGLRELQERRKAAMDSEPVAWTWQHLKQWHVTNDEERARDLAWDGVKVEPLYRHAQQPVDSEFIPKNLDKALGVLGMAIPESREEFNFQTERWIQRLIDRVIRYADEFQEQPASVVQCPYPCGWDNLNKLAIQDAALVARGLVEGELTTEAHRQAAISNNDRLLKVISACRAAMLAAAPQSPGSEPATVPGKWIPVSERMPLTPYTDCEYSDIEVNVFDGERVFTAHYATGSQPQPWGGWEDTYAKITHWQPMPAAPQEDKP